MNHNAILVALEDLMPEIVKTQDPEAVLLKYASEHNLAPAQLTRMGQYFNTAKTLNFMTKFASNRGGSFKIIDTEELENKYIGETKIKKAASLALKKIATAAPMEKAASAQNVEYHQTPGNIINQVVAEHLDQVLSGDKDEELPINSSFTYKIAQDCEKEMEAQVYDDIDDEYRTKLASIFEDFNQRLRLSDDLYLFSSMEEDVCRTYGEEKGKSFMDKVAKYVTDRRTPVVRWRPDGLTKLARDRHGIMTAVNDALDAFECLDKLDELVKSAAQVEDPPPRERAERVPINRPQGGRGQGNGGGAPRREAGAGELLGKLTEQTTKTIDNAPALWDDIWSPLDKTVGVTDKARGLLGRVGTDSGHQRAIDHGIADARLVSNLQRLLLTDPIISKADPDKVASLFTTLMNTNSEVASDPNMLRYALREALEYDSVPLTTHQTMIDMAGKREKALSDKIDNENTVYGSGKPSKF